MQILSIMSRCKIVGVMPYIVLVEKQLYFFINVIFFLFIELLHRYWSTTDIWIYIDSE